MKKKILFLLLAAVFVLSLFGCAASKNTFTEDAIDGGMNLNGSASNGFYDSPSNEMAPIAPDKETSNNESSTDTYLETQKLIYQCDLSIETLEFEKTSSAIKSLIKTNNGFIESDSLSDDSWNWYYSDYNKNSATMREEIIIRIPTENYEQFLSAVDGVGKIRNKSESVINITKSYNDTQTTITMYEKEETMLLAMMEEAKSISEMLEVEQRLAEVQRKLAIYKSNMNSMETDLAFSTITVEINEVVQYTKNQEKLSFVERLSDAFKDSFNGFIDFLEGFVIVIVHVAPYLITLAICAAIIVGCIKNKKNKKVKQPTMHINNAIKTETNQNNQEEK